MEYIVIVGLIGLLSGIAYPSYSRWMRQATTQQTAEQLADLFRTAQERSVGEQLVYGVLMVADDNEASLISYGDSFEPNIQYTVIDRRTFDDRTALVDINLMDAASGTNQVRFTAAGSPSMTGSVRVTHRTSAATDWLVTITPAGATTVTKIDE